MKAKRIWQSAWSEAVYILAWLVTWGVRFHRSVPQISVINFLYSWLTVQRLHFCICVSVVTFFNLFFFMSQFRIEQTNAESVNRDSLKGIYCQRPLPNTKQINCLDITRQVVQARSWAGTAGTQSPFIQNESASRRSGRQDTGGIL